jgi:hypothetical protein
MRVRRELKPVPPDHPMFTREVSFSDPRHSCWGSTRSDVGCSVAAANVLSRPLSRAPRAENGLNEPPMRLGAEGGTGLEPVTPSLSIRPSHWVSRWKQRLFLLRRLVHRRSTAALERTWKEQPTASLIDRASEAGLQIPRNKTAPARTLSDPWWPQTDPRSPMFVTIGTMQEKLTHKRNGTINPP